MFGRFIKPRWKHANPNIRLKAIDLLDSQDDAVILQQLARGDASSLVRAAAAGRLSDLSQLDEIQQRDEAPSVREAASLRIMSLLAGTTPEADNLETRLRLIRLTSNNTALAYIATNSPDEMCQQAAIERLDDDHLLLELAISGASEALRLCAAQQIKGLVSLKKLAREGRDKRVVRMARDQAKALQEQQLREQAGTARVIHLADRLEQHARRRVDALYGPRLEQLEQQWQEHQPLASPELAARVSQALLQCKDQLSAMQESHRQEAIKETASKERYAAAKSLYQLLSQSSAEVWEQQLGELRSALATEQRRWHAANEHSAADPDERQAFEDLVSAFEKMLELASQASQTSDSDTLDSLAAQWPQEYARPAVLHRQDKVDHAPSQPASRKAPPGTPHRGLLVALKRELQKGNLRHANRLWHKAVSLCEEQQDSHLARELDKLAARRAELQDWHRFAAEPKKTQLCERMESLAESTMDAPQRATAIQALHEEWRELMSSDQDQDQALWDRFKAATDKAYEPCQVHFAEQDALRQKNLQQREALCDQLQDFVDKQNWEQADWQGVWQIRQQAPRDWKRYYPIRFTDGRDVQKRFSRILESLDEKLAAYTQAARSDREQLLERAAALVEHSDAASAAREAQTLQKQWRATAWLPPAQHRDLQKKFRATMDRIFQARNRQQDEQKAEHQQQLNALDQDMDSLQQCLDAPFSRQVAQQLGELFSRLEGARELRLAKGANRRLQQLRRRARERLDRQVEWEQWHGLYEALSSSEASPQCNEPDLLLAVAFEALAGAPTPEPERQRRLNWQLEALPAAMKRRGFSALDEMTRLLSDHGAPICQPVKQRMLTALARLEPGNE